MCKSNSTVNLLSFAGSVNTYAGDARGDLMAYLLCQSKLRIADGTNQDFVWVVGEDRANAFLELFIKVSNCWYNDCHVSATKDGGPCRNRKWTVEKEGDGMNDDLEELEAG